MKLSDLGVPPLLEIIQGGSQPLGLINSMILKQLTNTGQTIEGLELYAASFNQDDIIFALKQNNKFVTLLIGEFISDFPGTKKTIVIHRTYTTKLLRGKGYSPALMYGLSQLGYRLISDGQLSSDAMKVWSKLKDKKPVTAFDTDTQQFTTLDPQQYPSVRYVLEATYINKNLLLLDSNHFT
jgi:predicted GNAT family acetyltransferase